MRLAIVGGGPGGLITAYYLQKLLPGVLKTTIFEASPRLGGKVCTRSFESVSALYEAGVAELYNYRMHGEDPLRDLVDALDLKTVSMAGGSVVLGNAILNSMADIRRSFGAGTAEAVQDFYRNSRSLCTPHQFYADEWEHDNQHPWANRSLRELLDEIPDETARRYAEVAIHSDVASEPQLTNGLTGLKNVLMEDPHYMTVYSIQGGIERLIDRLRESIDARIFLETAVTNIARAGGGGYRLKTRHKCWLEEQEFDVVVCALPDYWLSRIEWPDSDLRALMQKHLAHYDHPAHYLRVTLLFQKPFWRSEVKGAYFMLDAFGGCCIYDESARHPHPSCGVLGWLIAGSDALSLSNLTDSELINLALDSLPEPLVGGRELYLEGRVHRWVGTVNALPGGNPIHDPVKRHSPSPGDPNLYLVGDYFFDSTLNGVVDSAEFVAASIAEDLKKQATINAGTDAASSLVGQVRESA